MNDASPGIALRDNSAGDIQERLIARSKDSAPRGAKIHELNQVRSMNRTRLLVYDRSGIHRRSFNIQQKAPSGDSSDAIERQLTGKFQCFPCRCSKVVKEIRSRPFVVEEHRQVFKVPPNALRLQSLLCTRPGPSMHLGEAALETFIEFPDFSTECITGLRIIEVPLLS